MAKSLADEQEAKKELIREEMTVRQQAALEQSRAELERKLAGEGLRLTADGKYERIPEWAEAQAAAEREKARGKAEGEREGKHGIVDLSAATAADAGERRSLIDESRTVASELEKVGSWAELRKTRTFAGMDDDGIAAHMKNLSDRLARARTGAAMNKNEEALYDRLTGGSLDVAPQQAANLLRKLASAEARILSSKLKQEGELKTRPLSEVTSELDEIASSGAPSKGTRVYTLEERRAIDAVKARILAGRR
jgi:hypothetical protein